MRDCIMNENGVIYYKKKKKIIKINNNNKTDLTVLLSCCQDLFRHLFSLMWPVRPEWTRSGDAKLYNLLSVLQSCLQSRISEQVE